VAAEGVPPARVAASYPYPREEGRVVLFPVMIFNEYHPHWIVGGH